MVNGSTLSVVPGANLGLTGRLAGRTVGVIVSGATPATMSIDGAMLAETLVVLDGTISVIVFLVESDTRDDPLIERLAESLAAGDGNGETTVAICRVAAVNAAKRVMDGVVVEAVDRASLNLLRTPEAVDRHALERALATSDGDGLIRPAELVAKVGGSVVVVD